MSPVSHVAQPFEAALPSDFDHWPALARVLWKELRACDAWRAQGWAHLTHRQLGEAMARALKLSTRVPVATVRRWLTWLVERGEVARACVARGTRLPDESLAWCDHWLVLPGAAMTARDATRGPSIRGGIDSDQAPDRSAEGGGQRRNRPVRAGSEGDERPRGSVASDVRAPFKDSRLSSLSGPVSRSETLKLRTKPGESESKAKPVVELAPPVRLLAERVLRCYAEASGVRVAHFRASSRAIVAACLDEMDGEDAAKEMRLTAVIASAIAESRKRGIAHPSLAYVFNVRHVRRRLERLAEAEHLAQKAADVDAGGDMFTAGFDTALVEARAELAAGVEPKALDRARTFIESGRVTDVARVAAFQALRPRRGTTAPPAAKPPRPAPKPAQDAPQRDSCPAAAFLDRSAAVSGPEESRRSLEALFATVMEDVPPTAELVSELPLTLTPAERAELELAQEHARARWAPHLPLDRPRTGGLRGAKATPALRLVSRAEGPELPYPGDDPTPE